MSALNKRSKFYYGHTVTVSNQNLDFVESSVAKLAQVDPGSYSLTKFLQVVAQAINAALTADVTISIDRTTRIVTLNFSSAVDLLCLTGTHAGQSIYSLLGLASVDHMGVTTVVGTSPCGLEWKPQFFLQDYIPSKNSVKAASSTVSKSASGRVSVQKFGVEKFIKFNARFVTDIPQNPDFVVETDSSGVQNLRDFLNYAITKAPLEFMENRDDADTFERVILESTPMSGDGTGFELKERYDLGIPSYFDTGNLIFRVVEGL